MMKIKTAIHGAAGRMGQRLIALGHADPDVAIVGAIEHADHPKLGDDAGILAGIESIGVALATELPEAVDAVIDFSVPNAAAGIVDACAQRGVPLVLATTGFDEAQQADILAAARKIPIVWAPSMSLAVNLTMKLSEIAAAALADCPGGADVEIIERHHRFKEDAPSGTALRFGELIAAKMRLSEHVHGREGRPGARPRDEIAYHAVRTGDNPGEHTIIFGLLGETLELRVAATNRDAYAQGALAAAKFIVGKPPGVYSMNDVLGL